jgi:hypothetical protein
MEQLFQQKSFLKREDEITSNQETAKAQKESRVVVRQFHNAFRLYFALLLYQDSYLPKVTLQQILLALLYIYTSPVLLKIIKILKDYLLLSFFLFSALKISQNFIYHDQVRS